MMWAPAFMVFFIGAASGCTSQIIQSFFNGFNNANNGGGGSTGGNTGGTGGTSGTCKCGQANRITKIVGGVVTEENEYPWQVGLISSSGSRRPFCGGTLISSKEVLTAAHCTEGGSANYVLLGEHDLTKSDGERTIKVCSVLQHSSYSSNTVDYDFSILRLCEDAPIQTDIRPACLPSSSSNNYDNVQAVTSGWGTLSSGGSTPSKLMEATVQTMSNTKCGASPNIYGSTQITSRMICASSPGKDACQGDSGGPLVTKESSGYFSLIGVVSWGAGCAQENAPGVYARTTNQLSWIKARITGTTCG